MLKMMQKRERLEKQMYREISKGNFDKSDALRKKIVDLDVEMMKLRNS